jgi:hypothetical protein
VGYGEGSKSISERSDDIRALGETLIENGYTVESVLYHHSKHECLEKELAEFDVVMVWVDPIVQGIDRRPLDLLLADISKKGVYVSTHPDVIAKIGTKEVLYTTKDMDWGGDVKLYSNFNDFENQFLALMNDSSIRIIKKHRGSSGNGIYKISCDNNGNIRFKPASSSLDERILTKNEFHNEFREYFENGGLLIDQPWAHGITNGMVRCYLTGTKVSGFGYQESIALCPYTSNSDSKIRPISKRFYFSEYCGLFQDLRAIMESKWIPELQKIHSISDEVMPILWDIDLFINDVNSQCAKLKYTLCEINVSGVSPFPQSCIPHIIDKLNKRLT